MSDGISNCLGWNPLTKGNLFTSHEPPQFQNPTLFTFNNFCAKDFQKKKLQPSLGPSLSNHLIFYSSPFNIHTTRASGPAFLLGYHSPVSERIVGAVIGHIRKVQALDGTSVERVVNHWWFGAVSMEIPHPVGWFILNRKKNC